MLIQYIPTSSQNPPPTIKALFPNDCHSHWNELGVSVLLDEFFMVGLVLVRQRGQCYQTTQRHVWKKSAERNFLDISEQIAWPTLPSQQTTRTVPNYTPPCRGNVFAH